MITVVLIEPENDGNVGAVARVMANFDFEELVLINPKCNHLSDEALSRSKHAKLILEKARIEDYSFLRSFDYLIGTSAITGTDYNVPRSPLTPEQLAKKISAKSKTAILFGRESYGLTVKEVLGCDFIVKIPSSDKYKTLNLSHSVTIILYELFKKQHKDNRITPATSVEKNVLLKRISDVLDNIKFATPDKKETQKKVWKRVIGKSMLTKRESFALIGFFKKIK